MHRRFFLTAVPCLALGGVARSALPGSITVTDKGLVIGFVVKPM